MAKNKKSSNNSGKKLTVNKLSFFTLATIAILYLVSIILSAINVNFIIVSALQGVATALVICIVAYLAWHFVKGKSLVWKLLYIIVLLVIILGIILPLVL